MKVRELKDMIEGAGVGSENWIRATTELSGRMDTKAKWSIFISAVALVIAGLSWWFPRQPVEHQNMPPTVEAKSSIKAAE